MLKLLSLFFLISLGLSAVHYTEILDKPIVINLDRHSHRYEETKYLMEKAGFTNIERFSAVDGFFVDPTLFKKLKILGGGYGQKGCTASHLLIWKEFLKSDREFLFVAEDDMLPHSAFFSLFPFYWKKTPQSFDLLMVGNQMKVNALDDYIISKPSVTTHAYIISKKGAKKLLELYKKLPKEDDCIHIIDIFLYSVMNKKAIEYYCYNGLRCPDVLNQEEKNIAQGRSTGICFQNEKLGSTIHGIEIVH